MVQGLRVFAALPEDLMVAYNHLYCQSTEDPVFSPDLFRHQALRVMHRQIRRHTCTYNFLKI